MDTQEITLSQDASKKVLIGTVKSKSSKESHPNSWRLVRLGEVCKKTDLVNPVAYPEKPFTYIDVSSVSNESYRIIETRMILGKDAPSRAKKSVLTDDVIFATVRPTLKRVAIIPFELYGQVCSTGFCVLRANRKALEPQYLYFLLLTEFVNQRVESLQKGATYPAINDTDLFNLLIPLPPISQQDAIAHVLQRVQEAIQARQDELNLEREHKAALMEYLFTQGTRGETTKQTEIGEIPQSWEVMKLGDICKISTGTTPATDNPAYYKGSIPFIKTSEIVNNKIIKAETYISEKARQEYNLKVYPPGTVFMAMYGQGKTRGQVSLLDISAATTQNTAAIISWFAHFSDGF